MEVSSELEAVVAPTDEARPAASVAVMLTSVARPVTVSLADIAGTGGSTTPPALVVPAAAFLSWWRLQEDSRLRQGGRSADC